MKTQNIQAKREGGTFFESINNTACREQVLLLKTGAERSQPALPGGLFLFATFAGKKDSLEVRPAGVVWFGSITGPGAPITGGGWFAFHQTREINFRNSGFASGFFEGKPRRKTYKQKHLRKH